MAEEGGFGPYHVPQQSRRDKLREMGQSHFSCIGELTSLYDPSMISPDLLTTLQQQGINYHGCSSSSVTQSTVNQMGFSGGGMISVSSSSSSATHHMYMDPQSSIQLNPSSIHDINNNPYLYTSQGFRFLDQSYHDGEMVLYRPEPLSAAHAANNTSTDQGLSLSLSSPQTQESNLPLELNLQRYDSSLFNVNSIDGGCGGNGSSSNELLRTSVPLGPFSGYASILKGSRFLKPAQQLLEEICDVGKGIYVEKIAADDSSAFMDSPVESLGGSGIFVDPQSCNEGGDSMRKSRLISMLHEVFRRYKQYYQQMQAVVSSFESVSGLSNAAPFASLALKSMSRNFRSLKKAITDQLRSTTESHGHINYDKDNIPRFSNPGRGNVEHQPVWRPQRGLPERAVSVLKAWLFEHFLHPYPTDTDKLMLASQTGLSRSQVSNWFINARVRLWKPMVEEVHMLETQQSQRISQRNEQDANRPNENPSTSSPKAPDFPSKRTRNNMAAVHVGSERPMHLSYDNFSHHPDLAISTSAAAGYNGVSLTLGLHQNIGIGLSEAFPVNAARRFGLDANSEGYVVGDFAAPNRHCGRDIVGGQLGHDFVG